MQEWEWEGMGINILLQEGMGIFVYTTMGMGWELEYCHGNEMEWDRKSHSRKSLYIMAIYVRISTVEQGNERLKQLSAGLLESVDNLNSKTNLLEQSSRRNKIIIFGVNETYAERTTTPSMDDDFTLLAESRMDTITTVCSFLKDA